MFFLTEDDVRTRCPKGGTLTLGKDERLTPSAREYAASQRISVASGASAPCSASGAQSCPSGGVPGASAPRPAASPASGVTGVTGVTGAAGCGMTYLDANTQVPKTHPRIVLRGKLDSLLAACILAETQFDPKDRLPAMLKECFADVTAWVMQILAAEVGGTCPEIKGMGGMDMETLYAVSREPARYISMDHSMAEAAQGGNVALINWIRALTRETEIEAIRSLHGDHTVCHALNRLSSALYVFMLLAMSAQKGKDPALFRGE